VIQVGGHGARVEELGGLAKREDDRRGHNRREHFDRLA
jgi:hypothetical protein